ncbi:MAG: 2Fe-2S iron-sulfur cluster-binding protein [Lautropia sp.]|nr:2Fe-2S iron-sulfur cluster-binding protein [Lautropia sp.]
MARFHPLQVVDVRHETRDSVVVTLRPQEQHDEDFRFIPGQYLTFRRRFGDLELRRSYSICSGLGDGTLRVGIKRVAGGVFSTWANEALRPGDVLESMPPMGNFHMPSPSSEDPVSEPAKGAHYLGFAAGSGITPLLSIIKSTLASMPHAQFTLVYANRQISSVMFREELEDLKNIYLGRLAIIYMFNREGQEIDLFSGRLDSQKCEDLFRHWIDLPSVKETFICGPEAMMLTIADVLRAHGKSNEHIHFELFASARPPQSARLAAVGTEDSASERKCNASITLDGVTRSFDMPMTTVTVLDAALDNHMDVPYACKAGICSTCRARVLEGEVDMLVNHALEDGEVSQGYVLTCQCVALSERVVLSFDE